MPEEVQHVYYVLSLITYQKYRHLHVLGYMCLQSGLQVEDLSSGLGGTVIFER